MASMEMWLKRVNLLFLMVNILVSNTHFHFSQLFNIIMFVNSISEIMDMMLNTRRIVAY